MSKSTTSNQDSSGTADTTERVFPARTLVVKSPIGDSENPFNRLYGLRKAPSTASEPSRSPGRSPHKQVISEYSETAKNSDGTAESYPVTEFTQEDLVENPVSETTVEDMSSTHAHEKVIDGDDLTTTRFSLVKSKDGKFTFMTNLGSEGVQSCEDEPIHTPGAVQSFGVLLTLRLVGSDCYQVHHVSEVRNSSQSKM